MAGKVNWRREGGDREGLCLGGVSQKQIPRGSSRKCSQETSIRSGDMGQRRDPTRVQRQSWSDSVRSGEPILRLGIAFILLLPAAICHGLPQTLPRSRAHPGKAVPIAKEDREVCRT